MFDDRFTVVCGEGLGQWHALHVRRYRDQRVREGPRIEPVQPGCAQVFQREMTLGNPAALPSGRKSLLHMGFLHAKADERLSRLSWLGWRRMSRLMDLGEISRHPADG